MAPRVGRRDLLQRSLRHQAEIARTVTVGDAFWTGPRDERDKLIKELNIKITN